MKFKLSDYGYPLEIWNLYRFLQKSNGYTREQLVDYQNKKLNAIIEHAYSHVPYYRELFEKNQLKPPDIQTVEDLVKIPVLAKETVRERFDDLIADNAIRYKPYLNRTSGSTGTPLKFMQDKNVSIARFAFFWHIWRSAGYRPYLKWAQIDGMFEPDDDSIWRYDLQMNSLQISAYSLNEQNCKKILKKISTFRPKIVRGFPSALYVLAQASENLNFDIQFKPKSVITYSEQLYPFQRELINKVFGCPVYNIYSMWEAVCLIAECASGSQHQYMEFSVMELLDKNNSPVQKGESGEITATSFYNYAMPFIRYKTGDLATLAEDSCSCGRAHVIVKDMDGRKDDSIITPEGNRISRLSRVFRNTDGYNYAQVRQVSEKEIVVLLVPNDKFQENTTDQLKQELQKRLGTSLKIEFRLVDDIEPLPNGKRRLVVNDWIRTDEE